MGTHAGGIGFRVSVLVARGFGGGCTWLALFANE